MDKRNLLRANPPKGKHSKCIAVYLSATDYEAVYFRAFDDGVSLADCVREALRNHVRAG